MASGTLAVITTQEIPDPPEPIPRAAPTPGSPSFFDRVRDFLLGHPDQPQLASDEPHEPVRAPDDPDSEPATR